MNMNQVPRKSDRHRPGRAPVHGLMPGGAALAAVLAAAASGQPAPAEGTSPGYAWLDRGCHVHTMAWSAKQKRLYRRADPQLLSIWRVANPEDDQVIAGNDFFRNALAVRVGDALVVSHFALRFHWDWDPKTRTGRERHNAGHSPAYVKRSTDHGRTWGEGVRLEDAVGQGQADAFYMAAVGTAGDAIYIVARIDGDGGVYRSDDAGATWRLVGADLNKSNPAVGSMSGIGPALIDHPEAGLMIFGMVKRPGATGRPHDPRIDSAIRIANSTDGGRTWKALTLDIEDPAVRPVEPTALLLPGGRVLVYARNGPNGRDFYPAQVLLDVHGPGDYQIVYAKRANHKGTQNPDTQGVMFNPVNNRVEAVFSNRGGSKPFADDDGVSVSLWSIPLVDVLAGGTAWRYHGLLNTMRGDYGDGDPGRERDWQRYQDGSHPGLGVVDVKRNKHLAFMHMGASSASFAGTYMVERSLDTDAVGEHLIEHAAVEFGIRPGRHAGETLLRPPAGHGGSRLHFFVGPDGRYKVTVGVSGGGPAALTLSVGGRDAGRWKVEDAGGGAKHRFHGVQLRRGEEVRLTIEQDSGPAARIDFLQIQAGDRDAQRRDEPGPPRPEDTEGGTLDAGA